MTDNTVKIKVVIRGGDPLYTISGGTPRKAVRTRDGDLAERVAGARATVIAKHRMRLPQRMRA